MVPVVVRSVSLPPRDEGSVGGCHGALLGAESLTSPTGSDSISSNTDCRCKSRGVAEWLVRHRPRLRPCSPVPRGAASSFPFLSCAAKGCLLGALVGVLCTCPQFFHTTQRIPNKGVKPCQTVLFSAVCAHGLGEEENGPVMKDIDSTVRQGLQC